MPENEQTSIYVLSRRYGPATVFVVYKGISARQHLAPLGNIAPRTRSKV